MKFAPTFCAGFALLSMTNSDDLPPEVDYLLSNLGEGTPLDEDQLNARAKHIAGGTA